MNQSGLTVLLADDHTLVRQGLRALLEAEPGLRVVAEAGRGWDAVDLAVSLLPDVLVLDWVMPDLAGPEVAREVRARRPGTRILFLSMHEEEVYAAEALRVGALGYLCMDAAQDELVRAVREVGAGRRYLGPRFAALALEGVSEGPAAIDPYDTLTPREREVLALAALGLGNAELGRRLAISPRTVEIHRARVMSKLALERPADLVRYAIRRGIAPLAP